MKRATEAAASGPAHSAIVRQRAVSSRVSMTLSCVFGRYGRPAPA
jgi:hypothetical protein